MLKLFPLHNFQPKHVVCVLCPSFLNPPNFLKTIKPAPNLTKPKVLIAQHTDMAEGFQFHLPPAAMKAAANDDAMEFPTFRAVGFILEL